ncbi:MAG: pyruvate kinase [Spirochaetota bacterium]|nr:pyruvate kinase [Spirochaetota bacterium]
MQKIKKTKIIATLGPSSNNEKIIKSFIETGVDIFRLNFSHGTHDNYAKTIDLIRSIKKDMPIMADLKGAEIRTIVKPENGIKLEKGKEIDLVFDKEKITDKNFSFNYEKISQISKKNNCIMIDDGNINLKIKEKKDDKLVLISQVDGTLRSSKGSHFIGVDVPFPILTQTDKADIEFAISQNVDFIAASMIKSEKEIYAIRGLLPENISIVAKIEHPTAVENIENILEASDMILIARGDLGVELPITIVPIVQKDLVNSAKKIGKPVIIATQLLDSMMNNSRPTRAEVSDIANSIFDMADALMLTGETAAGKYPVEAVTYLKDTIEYAEEKIDYQQYKDQVEVNKCNISEAISYAAIEAAYSLNSKAIICFTSSGSTALRVAKFRPAMPIISFTTDEEVARKISVVFGIIPFITKYYSNTDKMIDNSIEILVKEGIAKKEDNFIITAGVPLGITGTTNMLKVIEIE